MSNESRDGLVHRVIELRLRQRQIDKDIERLDEDIERLDEIGSDTWPEGTVFRFEKIFVPYGRVYTYATIKAGTGSDCWYTTGPKNPGPFTWDELIRFIGSENISKVRVAILWTPYHEYEIGDMVK